MEREQAISLWNVVCGTPVGEEVHLSAMGVSALVYGAPTSLVHSNAMGTVEKRERVAKFLRDFADALDGKMPPC